MTIKANKIFYRTMPEDGNASDLMVYRSTKRVATAIKDLVSANAEKGLAVVVFKIEKCSIEISDETINELINNDSVREV